jgi:hypothetical protein
MHGGGRIQRQAVRITGIVQFAERDSSDEVAFVAIRNLAHRHGAQPAQPGPQHCAAAQQQVQLPVQQRGTTEAVHHRGDVAGRLAERPIVDQAADLGRQLRRLRIGTLQQQPAESMAHHLDVLGGQHG